MGSAMRRYAGVESRKTPAPITGANGGGRRSGRAPGIEVARPSVGRHGGSCERSKLVGPGLSRGARQGCRRQGLPGMEPGHLRCRRRARSRPEGARTRRRKQTGGPAMAETKPLTAYWMHDVIRISEPLTIGKHAWRLVQYRGSREPLHSSTRRPELAGSSRCPRSSPTTSGGGSTSDSRIGDRPGIGRSTISTMDSIAACRAACASSTTHARGPTRPRPRAPVPRRRTAITRERDPLERPDDNPRAKLPAATQPKGQ